MFQRSRRQQLLPVGNQVATPGPDWRTADPRDHGVDPVYLNRADRFAREEAPKVAAMLVVRHGHIVFERYYGAFGPSSYFSVASVTKSVLSALVGIALRDGLLRSVDQPIEEFFTARNAHGIRLRHLLALTAGWPYHDFHHRPETIPEMLDEPLAARPGERFLYGESPPHVLSAVLSRVTGMSAAEFALRELFQPLGMCSEAAGWRAAAGTLGEAGQWPSNGLPWICDAGGVSAGGYGLHLTARDMSRFGMLYAAGGAWDGRQLLPAEYVAASTSPQSRGGSPMWMPYGWLWWTPTWHRGHAMLAAGFQGQAIYVNSYLDLVIVLASKPTPATKGGMDDWTVLTRYLIPAATDWGVG